MIQWAALGLAASLLAGCERAGVDTPAPLQLSFRPVDIRPAQLNGVQLMGAHVLRSPHPEFGGFSGLSIRNGRMVAVSDAGWRLTGRIADGPGGLRAQDMTFTALSDRDGAVFDKNGGDAESLSWRDEQLVVGFERDHRLMVMDANGRVTRALRNRRFERMTTNKGLEALATLPDGTLLAVGEAQRRGAFRMFRISPAGKVTQASLPAVGPHFATGADIGPDGQFYLLLRDYRPLLGVSIRIERFSIGANGWPDPGTRTLIASLPPSSGIDNMEGLSVWQDAAGRTRIALISDDNFSVLQRTLLVDLVVATPS